MNQTFLIVELLVIAITVAIVVKYVRLPYTIALVLAGVGVGFLPEVPALPVAPSLWLLLFLPPLLFEGTIHMDLELLRRYATPIGILALFGTLTSVCLLASVFHFLLGMSITTATLLGVVLSPTDPVSVLALFRELGVAKGLQTIVEGESVFNDGVAVVLYLIVLETLHGEPVTLAQGAIEFLKVVAGGALIGSLLGYLTHRLYSVIDDHLIEVGLSVALAYGVYLLAERLEVSGVIAVVAAGLIIGNYGRILSMSPSTRLSLGHFWEIGAFLINGLLFLLIGLTVERGRLPEYAAEIAIVFLVMLAARAVVVYGFLGAYRLAATQAPPFAWWHVVNWGGVRGSIPAALALGLPAGVPQLERLRAITLGAVFLSLVLQGLTIKPLLRSLGLVGRISEEDAFERARGLSMAARAALQELRGFHDRGEISDILYENMAEHYEQLRRRNTAALASMAQQHETVRQRQLGRVSARLFAAERNALDEAMRQGLLSEQVWRELSRDVDARLIEGEESGWKRLWSEERVEFDSGSTDA